MVTTRSQGCIIERPDGAPVECSADDALLELCGLQFRPDRVFPGGSGEPGPDGRGVEIRACRGDATHEGLIDVWALEGGQRKRSLARGTCLGDRPEGEWSFNPSGLAKTTRFYVRGSLVMEVSFDAKGRLRHVGGFLDGKHHGTWRRWDASGELEMVIEYDRGESIKSTPYPDRPPAGPDS